MHKTVAISFKSLQRIPICRDSTYINEHATRIFARSQEGSSIHAVLVSVRGSRSLILSRSYKFVEVAQQLMLVTPSHPVEFDFDVVPIGLDCLCVDTSLLINELY